MKVTAHHVRCIGIQPAPILHPKSIQAQSCSLAGAEHLRKAIRYASQPCWGLAEAEGLQEKHEAGITTMMPSWYLALAETPVIIFDVIITIVIMLQSGNC